MQQRFTVLSIATSAIMSASCHDGLLNAPAAPAASVSMTASLSLSSGGTRQAYDKVDRMLVRFSVGSDVRLDEVVPFNPATAQTTLRVTVPIRASTEAMTAEIELRRVDTALFRATTTATLSTSAPTPVNLTLIPIVAGVSCGSAPLQLSQYGAAGTLAGAAIFATRDTVTSAPLTWSASGSAVSVAEDGQLIALQDGSATATCSAGGFSATRTIQVLAVPRVIQVDPATANIVGGNPVSFVAEFFDALGNAISSPQTVIWASNNTGVATVTASGVVSAATSGTARISAAIGPAIGNSTVTSIQSAAGPVTVAATGISGAAATLVGSVPASPPNSTSATEAWFAWGTSQTSGNQISTPHQTLPAGSGNILISDLITGLTPGATYFFQVVTQNGTTTTSGAVHSFQTPALPSAATLGQDSTYTRGYALLGSATPNGSSTVAWFEFGTSPTLATFSQTVKQPIGAGTAPVTLRHGLPALQPSTKYFARVAASNSGGTTAGSIVSFTTAP